LALAERHDEAAKFAASASDGAPAVKVGEVRIGMRRSRNEQHPEDQARVSEAHKSSLVL
jgi:hypothetical protein